MGRLLDRRFAGQQTQLVRFRYRFLAVGCPQLAIDLAGIPLDRISGQHQPLGDFAVGQVLTQQCQDITLPPGQRFDKRAGRIHTLIIQISWVNVTYLFVILWER